MKYIHSQESLTIPENGMLFRGRSVHLEVAQMTFEIKS